jgi:hypothetical protein
VRQNARQDDRGGVHCSLDRPPDADGTRVVIRDKATVIDDVRCTRTARCPRSVVLACRILAATTRAHEVGLAHAVEDLQGRTRFTVPYENVDLCRYDEIEFED